MLKLIYDLKAGFKDCYLTIKKEEWDLSSMLEMNKLGTLEYLDEIEKDCGPVDLDGLRQNNELDFFMQYCDKIPELLQLLEDNGEMDMLREDSVLSISKLYFLHLLGDGKRLKHVIPVWEPSNWKLDLDLTTRTSFHYLNAMSAKEVCDLLNLTRQQLHYYVKTGQIRKEVNPENPKQFKYNRTDVYVLQKKLEKKYDRYK
jgi:hypothetical protein